MKRNIKALLLVVLAFTIVFSLVACGHVHTYSTEWTATETHHYQAALCGHDVKLAEGEHQFGAWVEIADGTAKTKTCRVCQYQVVETIQHTHTFANTWTSDETNHWKVATCGHDVKDQLGAHQFDNGVTSGSNKVYTCTTCQYQKSEALPPHVCQFSGEWNIEQPATIFAEGLKTRACTAGGGCNEVESETIPQIEVVGITVKVVPSKTSYAFPCGNTSR